MVGTANSRQAYAIWAVALAIYIVAVLQRTSLSVAAPAAYLQLHATAASLAILSALQVAVYAIMQIPVGSAVDRWGSRRMIIIGALTMCLGQITLGLSTSVGIAAFARGLVGAGDATIFVSVIRLVYAWFPARRVPFITQVTGMVAQSGQLLSSFPLLTWLNLVGWTRTYLSLASLCLLCLILGIIALRDSPGNQSDVPRLSLRDLLRQLGEAWAEPGTRLGFWSHFTCQVSGTVFQMLWGFPFLLAVGVDPQKAGQMMSVFFFTYVVTGPAIGAWVAARQEYRTQTVLGITGCAVLLWTVTLLWPGPPPDWLLITLMAVLAVGIPGSVIGFDFARTTNPPHRLGVATGLVNVGAFTAAFILMLAFGLILEAVDGPDTAAEAHTLLAFRAAWSLQYLFWGVGVTAIVIYARRLAARNHGPDATPK